MLQTVVIKSNRYGLNLILDKDVPFQELLNGVVEKFRESEKFFKDASLAVSFEGRDLSQLEEERILDAIVQNSSIKITCILDQDKAREAHIKQQIDAFLPQMAKSAALEKQKVQEPGLDRSADAGKENISIHAEHAPAESFYRGTLRSGQILESESDVVVVGDVNPGATVISHRNIVILGSLKGMAFAGSTGNTDCVIAALQMEPIQVQIGDILAKSPDGNKKTGRLRKKKQENEFDPQIAMAKDGNIYIEPLSKSILSRI